MMRLQKHIPISADLLVWARERNNMPIAEVARRINKSVETIEIWEKGYATPTYSQLEKLASDVYKIPLAVLFRNTPPPEPKIKQKFRTLSDVEINNLPSSLMLRVREAQFFQESLKELLGTNNSRKDDFLSFYSGGMPIDQIATFIRQRIGIDSSIQSTFSDSREAFNYYRDRIEKNGMFVFQQPLSNGFRGYSLFDESYPIIVINSSKEFPNGKIFTLFHELSHIILGGGGITKNEENHNENDLEKNCNHLASRILVDTNSLIKILKDRKLYNFNDSWSETQLSTISKIFKVSREVILRRLLELNLTSEAFYRKKHDEWSQYEPPKKDGGSPSHYLVKLSQLGRNYANLVFQNLYNGRISLGEASNYLRTRNKGVGKLESLMYSK